MAFDLPRLVHRAADAVDRRFGQALRRSRRVERVWVGVLDAIVARQSDRVYLRRAILPAVLEAGVARVLFVGVRAYTRSYQEAFRGTATEYWTTDIDPAAAEHGAPGRHVVCDVAALGTAFPAGHFDLVMINGVFGWGCDRESDMERALAAAAAVLRDGGLLLLGWNTDRVADPHLLRPMRALFVPATFAGLAHEKAFPGGTHVFAWFRKA